MNYFGADKMYWSIERDNIILDFETRLNGLTSDEVQDRLSKFGHNTFKNKDKKNALNIFIKQLTSPLIFILIAALFITIILKQWTEVVVIGLAIFVNAGLGFYREYHAENTIEKLGTFIKDRARVIRNGVEQEVDSELIVPGDIIKISYGNRIPADARILNINNLRVDEGVLTGESMPVEKKIETLPIGASVAERSNMVHAGTLAVEGFATAVVTNTGNNTQIGIIASLVAKTPRAKTPIQKGIASISWVIFICVIFIVFGIFFLGILRGQGVLEMLVLSAAISVGAVPESLPIALTVILSIGAERIAKRHGIARTLVAAETLGSASLIMTDKTGTLTEANMALVGAYEFSELVEGKSIEEINDNDNKLLKLALSNIDVLVENSEEPFIKWTFKGKPFEVNIAKTARDRAMDIEDLKERDISKLVIPFNSTHKFSVSKHNADNYVVMGAPDILLKLSVMDKDDYQKIESWILDASNNGKRLIAIATISKNKKIEKIEDVIDLKFAGILSFNDPIRVGVSKAIKNIENSGVKVIMITGDLKGTAISVARELGWDINDANVMTGQDLKELNDQELLKILPTIKVFARVTPEDKLRVGLLYRKLGEVVAMTGDGVNDAPALKAMDIGVAVGSGSDVAKSASDLVLLNDSFETIGASVLEGRRILSNIRKTFVYLMSNSLDEVFVVGGSLIVGLAIPISALQIIWVNLFTGSLPALAFAYDEDFDHRRSVKHTNRSLFTKPLSILTFGVGTLSSLLLFVMYYVFIKIGINEGVARSVFFVCFASYILVVAYCFRSLHKPLFSYPVFSNKKLNISVIIAALMLIFTVSTPFMRNIFQLSPIPGVWIWFVLFWLIINVLLVEGAKYLFAKKHLLEN